MKYNDYAVSYLIDVDTNKIVVENSSRKRLRRIARKKYSKQYRDDKSYIIVSGDSLSEAIKLYKKEIAEKDARKKMALSKSSTKKTTKKSIKPSTKPSKKTTSKKSSKKKATVKNSKPDTLFEELILDEEKELTRINKKNSK